MIIIAVFFRSVGKANHVLLSIGVMAISFSIHQHAMPFENDNLDMLEKYALACQFFTLYSGLFFANEDTDQNVKTIFTFVILIANGVFVCLTFYIMHESFFHRWCKRRKGETAHLKIRAKGKQKFASAIRRLKTGDMDETSCMSLL
jgi:hypothetical protein